ncbi:GntR family transcriptional regulator [Geodermatophilus sp. SYSU D00815]
MSSSPEFAAHHRITAPPSMASLAADALRSMVINGDLRPGDRLIENRLTEELGVSRPPLREAMRVLEQEGLIVQTPRKGAVVRPLTAHDVYEIVTLREEIERMAIRLGVPVRSPERLERLRTAFRDLMEAAEEPGAPRALQCNFAFHLAIVGLAGHRRLEDVYRSLSLQLQMCMAMNRRARSGIETARGDAARHRPLLELVEAGDQAGTAHAVTHHGQRTYLLTIDQELGGHSPESRAWFDRIRAEETAQDTEGPLQ